MTQKNAIDTSEGTIGTTRKAKELSLGMETSEVNTHPTPALDYDLSRTVGKEDGLCLGSSQRHHPVSKGYCTKSRWCIPDKY